MTWSLLKILVTVNSGNSYYTRSCRLYLLQLFKRYRYHSQYQISVTDIWYSNGSDNVNFWIQIYQHFQVALLIIA